MFVENVDTSMEYTCVEIQTTHTISRFTFNTLFFRKS